MPDSPVNMLSFDRGIQEILRETGTEDVRLPHDTSLLLPSEDHLIQQLDRVFSAESLEHQLLASLKPDIQDKDFLVPSRYQDMVETACRELRRMAGKGKSPAAEAALNDAAELLEGEIDLMGLLNTYRKILHRG